MDAALSPNGRYANAPGVTTFENWDAGDGRSRRIVESMARESLLRVSVIGDVDLAIVYGSGPAVRIRNIAAPLLGNFPGNIGSIDATPRDSQTATSVTVTIAEVAGEGLTFVRSFLDATGGAIALPPAAVRLQALTAAGATVRGQAVALATLDRLDLVSGSSLDSGLAIVEFVL